MTQRWWLTILTVMAAACAMGGMIAMEADRWDLGVPCLIGFAVSGIAVVVLEKRWGLDKCDEHGLPSESDRESDSSRTT